MCLYSLVTSKVYDCFTHLGSTVSVLMCADFAFGNILQASQCSEDGEEQEMFVFLACPL